jgi:RNA polymerase sigma-70 factor (ECF subfamily)
VTDDTELWERIRRGDAHAFDDFYRESAPRLQGFLRQLLGNRDAAEDVAQETFLQLWQRPNGFHPEKASLRAYLFGIGRKRAAEWWRQRGPDTDTPSDEITDNRPRGDAMSLMDDALSRLEPEQRGLLWLREVEGRSYVELSEILGIPLGTVRSRLFTAREDLRHIWRGGHVAKEKKVVV